MRSVVVSDLRGQIVLTEHVQKQGLPAGTRKYDKKKYCKKCGEYVEFDQTYAGKHGYLFHSVCHFRVRNKPRLGEMKVKYWTGKRI